MPIRQVREILRLTYEAALPSREVARRVGTGSTSVRVTLVRFRESELNWPLPDMTDTALEHALYGARRVNDVELRTFAMVSSANNFSLSCSPEQQIK